MTITLELPPETEKSLLAQAQARGLTLDAFVNKIITNQAAAAHAVKPLSSLPLDGVEKLLGLLMKSSIQFSSHQE